MNESETETILQFGSGKFLRAFADLFADELNASATAIGRVAVLQSTGRQRVAALRASSGCYHVAVRGLDHGERVDRLVEVHSIGRSLAAADDWPDAVGLAASASLRAVVSNVTEAGYALDPADRADDAPPRSFPAKLLVLLAHRFRAGADPWIILPCELLDENAQRLKGLVLQQADLWKLPAALVDWLHDACQWRSTLVDRIVSAPAEGDLLAARDPLMAVAEPFALWLIEGGSPAAGFEKHPAVQCVPRLEPFHLRKVRILNGAHTALVAKAMPLGFQTVRQAIEDPAVSAWLRALVFEEIVPVLEGRAGDAQGFAERTFERFANPFLEHRLADIALHHDVKLRTRLLPSYTEYRDRFGRLPKLLGEIVGGLAGNSP